MDPILGPLISIAETILQSDLTNALVLVLLSLVILMIYRERSESRASQLEAAREEAAAIRRQATNESFTMLVSELIKPIQALTNQANNHGIAFEKVIERMDKIQINNVELVSNGNQSILDTIESLSQKVSTVEADIKGLQNSIQATILASKDEIVISVHDNEKELKNSLEPLNELTKRVRQIIANIATMKRQLTAQQKSINSLSSKQTITTINHKNMQRKVRHECKITSKIIPSGLLAGDDSSPSVS